MALQGRFVRLGMAEMLAPIYAAMFIRQAAVALLAGVATESEVDETLRGMPHNVTTEMDLALWRLGKARGRAPRPAAAHPAVGSRRPLSRRRAAGDRACGFLRRYGHRGAAEVDVGLPRWIEDPTPVFAAVAGYLRVTDPEQSGGPPLRAGGGRGRGEDR